MKKMIAVLLCFAAIFAFAACTKDEPDTTTEPTGRPGDMVTNDKGDVVTVTDFALVLDENGEPQLDEKGNVMTTVGYAVATYPPAEGETLPPQTTVPTVAAGNTIKSENAKWPAHEFMSKLPKLRDNVDKATLVTTDKGQLATVYVNELSYADYLAYIETCKKAGFVQKNTGTKLPEKPEAGKSYIYYTVENGLYITMTYYTDEYPYRNCDLYISVSDYNLLDGIGTVTE